MLGIGEAQLADLLGHLRHAPHLVGVDAMAAHAPFQVRIQGVVHDRLACQDPGQVAVGMGHQRPCVVRRHLQDAVLGRRDAQEPRRPLATARAGLHRRARHAHFQRLREAGAVEVAHADVAVIAQGELVHAGDMSTLAEIRDMRDHVPATHEARQVDRRGLGGRGFRRAGRQQAGQHEQPEPSRCQCAQSPIKDTAARGCGTSGHSKTPAGAARDRGMPCLRAQGDQRPRLWGKSVSRMQSQPVRWRGANVAPDSAGAWP